MTPFLRLIACVSIGIVAAVPVSWAGSADLLAGTVPDEASIDACLGRLDPDLDIGYQRIAARCPDLVKQIEQGAWAAWLPSSWKDPGNDLSAGSLRELRELVSRESAAHASERAPDVRSLKAVLDGLSGKAAHGRWSRFKAWLRSILETREQAPDESWFSRLVAHVGLSQSLRQVIAYVALGAVVVLAAAIVLNELRSAGLLSPARRGRGRRALGYLRASRGSWSDVDRSPLLDRPRMLLELIIHRLGERGYLPPAGALTVRELARDARLAEPEDRSRLWELATAAERVRYSGGEVEAGTLERSLVRGRELLDHLDAGSAQ